jgi:hypothetical protein
MKMWPHLLSFICAAGFAVIVLIGTAEEARADCPDKLIAASKSKKDKTSGKYQWQGQCFKVLKGKCVPCGPKHSRNLKSKTKGYGKCSRRKIALARADGCSAPKTIVNYKGIVIKTPHKYRFRAACYEHDVCYATYGKKKLDCDKAFLANMKDMCKRGGPGCKTVANAYFAAVAATPQGMSSYRGGQNYAQRCK